MKRVEELEIGEKRYSRIRNSLAILGLVSFALIPILLFVGAYLSITIADSVFHVLGGLTAFFFGAAAFGKSVYKVLR